MFDYLHNNDKLPYILHNVLIKMAYKNVTLWFMH